MKKLSVLKYFIALVLLSTQLAYAVDLESTNYKISGLSINSGGDIDNSTSTNMSLVSAVGGNISTDTLSSTSYSLNGSLDAELNANVPLISCFETNTDGSTLCIDSDVVPNGMVQICGAGGCYDRARFEIDAQSNPSDTLYSVQIKKSTDSTWSYIDAATYTIETNTTHDINDYQTKTTWEGTSSNFNILGLAPNIIYQIRLTALNGDFTESGASPIATATTSLPSLSLDIDIANSAGSSTETSAPYEINFNKLSSQSVNVATNLVWMDINTNSIGGSTISVNDLNTGLYSPSTTAKISSADNTQIDLNTNLEGYGLLKYSSTQTNLGPLAFSTNFDNGGNPNSNIVGGVSTTSRQIINTSSKPIKGGRASISLKSSINQGTTAALDYSDSLTFSMVGSL